MSSARAPTASARRAARGDRPRAAARRPRRGRVAAARARRRSRTSAFDPLTARPRRTVDGPGPEALLAGTSAVDCSRRTGVGASARAILPRKRGVAWAGLAQRRRHGRAARGAGAAAGRRRRRRRSRIGDDARRARLDRADAAPGRRRLRRGGDRRRACRRSTGASSRPARPARRRAAGPTCCRPGAISTRSTPARCRPPAAWELGWQSAELLRRALCAGARRLAARDRAVGLGHREHAHRRRRHRAGAGADRRAPGLGAGRAAGSPASRSCRSRARPAAGRRDAAHLRLVPRCLPRPDRPVRQRRARGRRARRAGRRQPARRASPPIARRSKPQASSRTKPRCAPASASSARSRAPTARGCRR